MRRTFLVCAAIGFALTSAMPVAAEGPACFDGIDNDGDGRTDMEDAGCTDPGDPDESSCQPMDPHGCGGAPLCPGMLPPTLLHAEWTGAGVLLGWQPPLAGVAPTAYLIYRVLGESWDVVGDATDPLAAVPPWEHAYYDATARPGQVYEYWLTSAGPGCSSTSSNPAIAGQGIPDLAKCFYVHKETLEVTGPSTNCISGTAAT